MIKIKVSKKKPKCNHVWDDRLISPTCHICSELMPSECGLTHGKIDGWGADCRHKEEVCKHNWVEVDNLIGGWKIGVMKRCTKCGSVEIPCDLKGTYDFSKPKIDKRITLVRVVLFYIAGIVTAFALLKFFGHSAFNIIIFPK